MSGYRFLCAPFSMRVNWGETLEMVMWVEQMDTVIICSLLREDIFFPVRYAIILVSSLVIIPISLTAGRKHTARAGNHT